MSHVFKIVIYPRNGKAQNVTDICSEVQWTTERTESPGSLDFVLHKDSSLNFHEGDIVHFAIDNIFKFRGYVFSKDKDEKGTVKVKSYDQIRYLKAKQSYNFSGSTLTTIIQRIAADFNLECGSLASTGYAIPSMVMDNKSCIDTITNALEKTAVGTGIVYVFYDHCGKLTLQAAKDLAVNYILGDESSALNYSYKTSIDEDVYNYIKLVQPNAKTGKGDVYIATASNLIKDWGLLQFYKTVDESFTAAQIQELAKNMLKYYAHKRRTLKIECFGIPDIRAGNIVPFVIRELGDIGLDRRLLIERAVHKISPDSYTMDLTLSVYIDESIVFGYASGKEYVAVDTSSSTSTSNKISNNTAKAPSTSGSTSGSSSKKYRMPFHSGYRLTCAFGKKGRWSCGWHTGVDYVGTGSKKVYAICAGKVTKTGVSGSYGQQVYITHNDGYISLYAHLSKVTVSVGQKVTTSTQIGVEGATGNASGSHLHLELHKGAYKYPPSPKIDPNAYIKNHS